MAGFDGRHSERGRNTRLRWRAPLLLGVAVIGGALIVPAVGNAFSNGALDQRVSLAARGAIGSFTPASVDPRLLEQITVRALSHAQMFRFTPAGIAERALAVQQVGGGTVAAAPRSFRSTATN